jgi:hypothetical protein
MFNPPPLKGREGVIYIRGGARVIQPPDQTQIEERERGEGGGGGEFLLGIIISVSWS